jgi:two-component system LytT family response regulator
VSATFRALIVDDEALARRRLVAMLAAHPELRVIGEAESGSRAVAAIAGTRPEIVFLDVQMPGLDGFGVLRCTAGAHQPVVVFVTAFDEYAVRAFEVHAADYLVKPVTAPRLAEAVRRAVARVGDSPRAARTIAGLLREVPATPMTEARLPVHRPGGTDLVPMADVSWIGADGDHATLHLTNGTRSIRETMASLESRLAPFGFVRVHRGALVKPSEVVRVEPIPRGNCFLVLRNGSRVRTGRAYRDAVRKLKL